MAKSIDVSDLDIFYGSSKAVEGVTVPLAARSVTALIGPPFGLRQVNVPAVAQPDASRVIPGACREGQDRHRRP